MKRVIILAGIFITLALSLSFKPNQEGDALKTSQVDPGRVIFTDTTEKTVTIKFTLPEIEAVYAAIGKLPSEQVESLRKKILDEYNKQLGIKPK